MKRVFLLLLIILIISSCREHKNQDKNTDTLFMKQTSDKKIIQKNYPDSSTYWINVNYLNCIEKDSSVCDCLENNKFLLLHLDWKDSLAIIQSSIFHFGLETNQTYKIVKHQNKEGVFNIENEFLALEEYKIVVNKNQLFLIDNEKKYSFVATKMKTLDIPNGNKGIFTQDMDMFIQIHNIASHFLLKYPYTYSSDSTTDFFSFQELQNLISQNQISAYCSDDFQYNGMTIQNNSTNRHFHLEFKKESVTIYQEVVARNRRQKIELDKLKKQVFFRIPQN